MTFYCTAIPYNLTTSLFSSSLFSSGQTAVTLSGAEAANRAQNLSTLQKPASVALLVASRYTLPGYGDRRVWVRGPGWLNHCVRL